uniref:G-patch domain-containing protein n=1 Tax=Eptatretus burgeri TaxID=7764 RepID=A0A8C4R2M8_EPTBU
MLLYRYMYVLESFCLPREDVRPGLQIDRWAKQHRKERRHQELNRLNRQKSHREMEMEHREEALNTALARNNKGFAMLQKMGYKIGQGLGRQGLGVSGEEGRVGRGGGREEQGGEEEGGRKEVEQGKRRGEGKRREGGEREKGEGRGEGGECGGRVRGVSGGGGAVLQLLCCRIMQIKFKVHRLGVGRGLKFLILRSTSLYFMDAPKGCNLCFLSTTKSLISEYTRFSGMMNGRLVFLNSFTCPVEPRS